MKVVISGQKQFGKQILKACEEFKLTVVAVISPVDDYNLTSYAKESGYKIIPAGTLCAQTMPAGCDLGICAHSFDYIGKKTRQMPALGWIGYHPSLLPRHRGRSAIEWALRMNDIVIGGTWYWLNSGIDRGDIAYQDWRWLDTSKTAKEVWKQDLMPLGLELFNKAIVDISNGIILKTPQHNLRKFSTFEPGLDKIQDIFKPDLLLLEQTNQSLSLRIAK